MAWPQSGSSSRPSLNDGDVPVGKGLSVLAPVRGLAIGVVLGLCGWIVLALVHVGFGVWRQDLFQAVLAGGQADPGLQTAIGVAYDVSSLAQYAAVAVVAVVFVIWLFRVRANSEKINDRRHRWGRPWLVLAWIVPFANLAWPKQLVDDIWMASDPHFLTASAWRRPWLVRAWWTMWLLYLFLDRLVARVPGPYGDPAVRSRAAMNEVLVTPVGIAAALLAIWVVWRLSGLQETRGRELDRMLA
jgi:hypothetical protein